MSGILIRTCDNLDAAQHVREALLASGFTADRVRLDAVDDDERARACDIMDRFGAVDVNARTSSRPH